MVAVGSWKSSGPSQKNQALGYFLALFSSFLYAIYEVLYKRILHKSDEWMVILNQTLIGGFVLVFLGPFVPLFFRFFEQKPVFNSLIIKFLFSNCLFSISYFLIQAFAITLSSPFFFSAGSLFKIPMSALVDSLLRKTKFSLLSIFGFLALCLGILIINVKTFYDLKKTTKNYEEEDSEDSKMLLNWLFFLLNKIL